MRRPGSPASANPPLAPEARRARREPAGVRLRLRRPLARRAGSRRPLADPARVGAWALALVVALLAAFGGFGLSAELQLARARERLLAGDAAEAARALGRVHWPEASARKAAGLALSRALAGEAAAAPAAPPPLRDVAWYEPEALLEAALRKRQLAAAERLVTLLHGSGAPVADLYAAALRLDRGDEPGARGLAARSAVPLRSRALGARLERTLALRQSGVALPLALDRSGEAIATLAADGSLQPTAAASVFVSQALARAGRPAATPAAPMGAVQLTVDLELSRLALEALGEHHGSIVLLEPATGAVLAAVTDSSTALREPAAAFEQRREPASIAKLLTTAAAYRASHDADALIGGMRCTGVERYGGKPLWCPWPTGPLSGLDQALAVSCNIAFANLAMRVGRERLVEEYRRWGFDAGPGALLGAAGRVERPPELPRELADLAIGLESSNITPLHAAVLAATVANGGRMAEPHLVRGTSGLLGLAESTLPRPAPREIVSRRIAERLTRAMRAVVAFGTGAGLEPLGYAVAMKTGTASLPRLGYHVNYIGFGPVEAPTIAFCVRVTGRHNSHAVHVDAREVTGRLLAGLAARRAADAELARAQRGTARTNTGELR